MTCGFTSTAQISTATTITPTSAFMTRSKNANRPTSTSVAAAPECAMAHTHTGNCGNSVCPARPHAFVREPPTKNVHTNR